MLNERKEHLEVLRRIFTNNINYPFNGEEAVPFNTFSKKY